MRRLFVALILMFTSAVFGENSMKDNATEISAHYSALPVLYQFDSTKKENISDKIIRQYIMGAQSTLVKWTLKKGAVISLHFHPNEQITWIIQGSVKVISQGKEFIVKAGGVLIIPPNVPHEFFALEDTIDIDFFTPAREDWLNNNTSYIQAVQKK